MPADYLPILVLIALAAFVAVAAVALGHLFGPRRPTAIKGTPYESGMNPYGPGQRRVPVRFYLVAVLFILFDIEIVFLYPWAVHFGGGQPDGTVFATRTALVRFLFLEMLVFLAILFLGWYWVVRKKALDWEEA
jgi:NADH-quinone oxidoreductase subunit A